MRAAYAAHGRELYAYARRALGDAGAAEEAIQETFLRAWRAIDHYDAALGSLRTWLFAIVRNVVVDTGRARARRPATGAGDGIEPVADGEEADRVLLCWQVEEGLRRLGDHDLPISRTHRSSVLGRTLPNRPFLLSGSWCRLYHLNRMTSHLGAIASMPERSGR